MGKNRLLLIVLLLGINGAFLVACNGSTSSQAVPVASPRADLPPRSAGAQASDQTPQEAGGTAAALPASPQSAPDSTAPAAGQTVPFVGRPSVGAALRAAKANANAH